MNKTERSNIDIFGFTPDKVARKSFDLLAVGVQKALKNPPRIYKKADGLPTC